MPDEAMREQLGRAAHEAWAAWLDDQPKPWPLPRTVWEDRHPATRESFRRIGETVAAFAAEHCAQAVLAHMEAHAPQVTAMTGSVDRHLQEERQRAWRRHFGTAARVAAGAFMTGDDIKRAAGEALARGDFVACPSLESESGDA